jgi:hypothetical protein
MEVGAMQREVAMREGEARRFADGRHNRAPLYPFECVCDRCLETRGATSSLMGGLSMSRNISQSNFAISLNCIAYLILFYCFDVVIWSMPGSAITHGNEPLTISAIPRTHI